MLVTIRTILFLGTFFFSFYSCSTQNNDENSETFNYGNVILIPIANTTTRGLIKFKKDSEGVTISCFIEGLIPNKKYQVVVLQYGDLSSLDGESAGELLSITKKDTTNGTEEKKIIGDIATIESDGQGLIEKTVPINIDPTLFKHLIGRAVMFRYLGTQSVYNLGYGIVGIGNNEYIK